MRPWARRGLAILGLAGAGYAVPVVYLMANERQMIFQPDAFGGRDVRPLPSSLGLTSQRVTITTSDGVRLAGLVVPSTDSAAPWLLYLHGNAGNITSSDLPEFYRRWSALGVNVLAIDYRGYGESEPHTPDERGVYADARAAYQWLRTVRSVSADRIIIYGHSLGAGVATELALRVEAAGLIIEGAFTSVPDMGAPMYPWLPVRWLSRQRFENVEKIGRVAMPKLILHASDDDIVPFAHGQRLFAAAGAPKTFVELKGGHMRAFLEDSTQFWGHAEAFVSALRNSGPAGESPPPR